MLAGALLLALALVAGLSARTLTRLPDSLVYYVRDTGTGFALHGAGRSLGQGDPETHLRRAFQALQDGPTEGERAQSLSTAVPAGARILRLELEGTLLHLDLSAEIEAGGGTATMLGRLHQLFYTLTQPSYVERVSLSIEGRPRLLFSQEGLMIENPWARRDHPALPRW